VCLAQGADFASTGALACPHGTVEQPGGKNVPSASISLCVFPTDTTAKAQGLLPGTAMGVPYITGENPFSFINNKTQMISQIINHTQNNNGPVTGAHSPGILSGPPKRSALAPLRQNFASLEGHNAVPPRLHLA
jgi:hypothetical protein